MTSASSKSHLTKAERAIWLEFSNAALTVLLIYIYMAVLLRFYFILFFTFDSASQKSLWGGVFSCAVFPALLSNNLARQ